MARSETREQFAARTGKTPRTVFRWLGQGMPRNADGSIPIKPALAWVDAHVKPRGRPNAEPLGANQTRGYWETRKVRAQARQEELKAKQLAGSLVDVDAVARRSERRITHTRALLEQVPDRIFSELPAAIKAPQRKAIKEAAARMICQALQELSEAAAADAGEA